jgi:cytochrome P450
MHAAQMADELSERVQALRRPPLPYSLALTLCDAGVAAEVICQYVNVEQAALDGLYRIAEAKLLAAQKTAHGRDGADHKRLRRLVAKAFTPRGAERMRTACDEIINELLDRHIH